MKTRFVLLLSCLLSFVLTLHAQPPSVQIKIKEKSGFLGMGGPRMVQFELSAQKGQKPLDGDNVNAGPYYYFVCTPVGDWKIDADFIKEDLPRITIYQNEQKLLIAWKGEIVVQGATTSLLIGFPKTLKLDQLFLFQCQIGDAAAQVEFKVPQEYWPGYSLFNNLSKQADDLFNVKQYRPSISLYDRVLEAGSLQIFPQYADTKDKRTKVFDSYFGETWGLFQTLVANQQMDLKEKIAQIDRFKPSFQFFVDSLPKPSLNISAMDVTIAPIVERAKKGIAQIAALRDSLQRVLDDKNVRWIIEGSATGKDGYKYIYIVETLAYAFSSLNFIDTAATELKVRIPDDLQARLAKYAMTESYETFFRLCTERFQSRLPVFPVDFLPNLRKDTAAFTLPFYSMLKAVNDYYYGSLVSAREEIFRIFRTCYDPDLNSRFDQMRVLIAIREQRVPAEVMKMIEEGEQLEAKKDAGGALEKYRQATIIAPNFAYGYYALGKYYVRSGEQIRAITFFQKAYQIDTLYLSAYRDSYNLYMRQSNFKPMIEVLTLGLQRGNDYWEVNSNLGTAYMGDGDPARAIQHYERALGLNPKSYKTNINLGLAHQTVKNYQKAREYFNKAIDLDPSRQEAVDYLTKLNDLQRGGK